MKLRSLLASVIVPLFTNRAEASSLYSTGGISLAFNIVILAGAVACLVIAIRLFMLVRGGALARCWQMLAASFGTLAIGQILILIEKLGVFRPPFDIAGLLYLATVALWFAGLTQTRKVLE